MFKILLTRDCVFVCEREKLKMMEKNYYDFFSIFDREQALWSLFIHNAAAPRSLKSKQERG